MLPRRAALKALLGSAVAAKTVASTDLKALEREMQSLGQVGEYVPEPEDMGKSAMWPLEQLFWKQDRMIDKARSTLHQMKLKQDRQAMHGRGTRYGHMKSWSQQFRQRQDEIDGERIDQLLMAMNQDRGFAWRVAGILGVADIAEALVMPEEVGIGTGNPGVLAGNDQSCEAQRAW